MPDGVRGRGTPPRPLREAEQFGLEGGAGRACPEEEGGGWGGMEEEEAKVEEEAEE